MKELTGFPAGAIIGVRDHSSSPWGAGFVSRVWKMTHIVRYSWHTRPGTAWIHPRVHGWWISLDGDVLDGPFDSALGPLRTLSAVILTGPLSTIRRWMILQGLAYLATSRDGGSALIFAERLLVCHPPMQFG